jgi:predicted aldo/keto reductase-like oxidoreductase
MITTRLGKTGLEVSRVGMGGGPIQRPSEEQAIKVIRHALDLGINFIDTARSYRTSEVRIGKAIAGCREQVIVTTKGWGDKVTVQASIEESLKQLNTDYIDLWQFHDISTFEEYEQVLGLGGGMEGAQMALRAGKIHHIGLSSHSLDVALKAVASGHFETIQFPLNFIANEALTELVSLAREHDVGFIAMKPLAGGRIRNANLAFKYLLPIEGVVPDPGIERIEEIEEIVTIVNSGRWELTDQDRWEIEEIRTELGSRFCRRCQYCMPCPEGVNIWMLMVVQDLWRGSPADVFFESTKEIVESGRNCIQCGQCEAKCPYELPIREMIVENIEFYEGLAAEHERG